MKKLILYRLVRYIATYHFLLFLVILLVLETNGVSGKSLMKTKLLLQNIRTHLTPKPDEIFKEEECGLGLISCKRPKSNEEDEERTEEIEPPPKPRRIRYKPLIKVKPKAIVQTDLPKPLKNQKVRKSRSYRDLIHFPEALNFSEEDEKSDETEDIPLEEFKRPRDLLKPPFGSRQKLTRSIDTRFPKVGRGDSKDAPALQNVKKIVIKKAKLEGEETGEKIRKTWTKDDKKTESGGKGKRRAKPKADKRRLQEKGFAFPNEPFVFVSDSDTAQRNTCRKHSQFYLKQLEKREIWALMMYDASAKLAAGILQGNANQLGDFDECLSVNVVFKSKKKSTKSSGIKGKYCLANIDVRSESQNDALLKIQERVEGFRFIKSTIHDPGHFIPRFSTVNWGVCVPSACLAEDVEKFLKSRFDFFNNASGLAFDVRVDEDNCVVKDDLELKFHPEMGMTTLLYFGVLSLSLCATYLDAKARKAKISRISEKAAGDGFQSRESIEKKDADLSLKEKGKRIIAAFSLKKNIDKLFTDKNRGGIECINGIKSIFTILLYFAHKTIPLAMTPFTNRVALTKISNQPVTALLRASIVYTDSFLLMSGMLTAYGLAKDLSEKKEISWMKKSVGRIIRLTPPLLAVVLFYAYIWGEMGSGPMWNLIVRRNSLLCRRYMWRNLLYIQNLFEFENMCAPQTHQLALDMQFSLLAPLFVHLMHKHDKVGIGALQALFVLSSIMRYITTFNNNLSVVIYHGMPVAQLYKTANLLYAQALHRASPYILGTVVGYHLRKFEKQFSLPKAFAAIGWVTAFSFGYYSLVTPSKLASRTYRYNVEEAAQYAALSPVAWSLALSWVIAACHFGFGGKLNEFLCHRIFVVFSRISYSVYLTQFLVFFYKIGLKKIPEMFTVISSISAVIEFNVKHIVALTSTPRQIVKNFDVSATSSAVAIVRNELFSIIEFVTVIFISVITTLLFDIPIMEIKKIILDEKATKTLPEESHDTSETFRQEDERASEALSGEDSQGKTEELSEGTEDDGGEEEEMEGSDAEGADEDEDGGDDDDEMIEAVFEIRPLRRPFRTRFSDESENK